MEEEKKKNCCRCEPDAFRRAIRKLMRTERMYQAALDSRMSVLGTHRSQCAILHEIGMMERKHPDQSISQKDIAERFGVSAAAVAMTLKKMEAEGYIKREMSEKDNRFNELHLTEKGREALCQSRTITKEIDDIVYNGITKEEIEGFIAVIKKMQNNLASLPELEGKSFRHG